MTIAAGTIVNLSNYLITVNGTLNAIGSYSNPIYLNGSQIVFTQFSSNWNESTGIGCIINNAILNSSLTINNSPKLNNDTVYGAITINGNNAPVISTNTINGGITTYGNGLIANNTILGQGITMPGSVYYNQNVTISGNKISGCSTGIYVRNWDDSGLGMRNTYVAIKGNLIVGNNIGVEKYGANFYGGNIIDVENNTITKNAFGVYINPVGSLQESPIILNNNIYNNSNYNIKISQSYNINATYNWWGTIDSNKISQSMYDYSVNSNLGAVIFNPFLTTLNPNAPTIPIFNVSASAGANGAINPTGDVTANYGSSQNFTITPNVGYHVADVVVDNISQGVLSSYTFLNVVGPRSISATFAINTYTITVTQSANGNISPGTSIVNYGDDKSFTITANTGYYIVSVSVNGSSVGAVSSYIAQNIQGATSISATFAPIPAPTASPTPIPTQTQSSTNPPVPTQTQSPTPTLNPNPHKPTIFSVQITALQKSNTDKMGNWQCSRMWLWLDFLTARLHRQQIFRL